MRAVLHDAEGPRKNRVAPLVLLPVAALVAMVSPSHLVGFASVMAVLMAAGVLPRFAPRAVEVVPGGGAIHVRKAGIRDQTISTKDVVGASTARLHEGFALTLSRRDRKAPTTLVFETEADLERAREALAIGHGGFGDLSWPLVPGGAHTWARTSRAVAAAMALVGLALGLGGLLTGSTVSPVFGWLAVVFAFLPAIIGVLGLAFRDGAQWLRLGRNGVTLAGRVRQQVPYAAVQGIEKKRDTFTLGAGGYALTTERRLGSFAGAGVDDHEMRIIGAQLAACVARARGQGPEKEEAHTRVDTLRRGREAARDWLARIDVAANALLQTGYRGSTIDKDDLWLLLRDPEAAEDLRAAAGRMLVRVETEPEVRARVGDIVAAVREPDTQERLRVAIFPDLDPTGVELEQLEERALLKRALPRG